MRDKAYLMPALVCSYSWVRHRVWLNGIGDMLVSELEGAVSAWALSSIDRGSLCGLWLVACDGALGGRSRMRRTVAPHRVKVPRDKQRKDSGSGSTCLADWKGKTQLVSGVWYNGAFNNAPYHDITQLGTIPRQGTPTTPRSCHLQLL